MPTLAPKLPWTHAFAGGYPRVGGQPLPTDPDAIDYLNRVAAADGAAVEVGVAMAVDAFVKGCKADSAGYAGDPTRTVWDALQASCIMCGARTLAGALVSLKGASPTNVANNFVSSDYSRTTGLKGDGSTKYLDSNYAYAQNQDDSHLAIYRSEGTGTGENWIGGGEYAAAAGSYTRLAYFSGNVRFDNQGQAFLIPEASPPIGFAGIARTNSTAVNTRYNGVSSSLTDASVSVAGISSTHAVFLAKYDDLGIIGYSSQRAAFYSIGSALDLAALDSRVSTLVAAIAAAL